MKLGYVRLPEPGQTDAFLAGLASHLQGQGLKLAGTVQVNSGGDCAEHCDMDLHVLPAGPILRISQNLGPSASGCRLDAGALEEAVALSRVRLQGADLLIVNKFGKHEAEGRGFRELIAEALAQGLPVVIGVNGQNVAAFHSFSGALAEPLAADAAQISGWIGADIIS